MPAPSVVTDQNLFKNCLAAATTDFISIVKYGTAPHYSENSQVESLWYSSNEDVDQQSTSDYPQQPLHWTSTLDKQKEQDYGYTRQEFENKWAKISKY